MAIRGAGGTSGGIGQFFFGLAMSAFGFFLFFNRVAVTSNFSTLWGGHFGLLIVPLGLGIALLFFSARSLLGWLLTIGSFALIFVSILANLTFYFQSTNFFTTVMMIALMFGGMGLMVRSFRTR